MVSTSLYKVEVYIGSTRAKCKLTLELHHRHQSDVSDVTFTAFSVRCQLVPRRGL